MKKRYLDIKFRNHKNASEAVFKIPVYLTPVAGLCIHAGRHWSSIDNSFTIVQNRWVITQYPSGLRAFGDIHSKEMALDIVMRYMAEGFNWVGLTGEDIMKSNDSKALQEMASKVAEHIRAANKLISNA